MQLKQKYKPMSFQQQSIGLPKSRKRCLMISVTFILILMTTLLFVSTTKKRIFSILNLDFNYIDLGANKKIVGENSCFHWMYNQIYYCAAQKYQNQHPGSQKIMEKFKNIIFLQNQRKSYTLQYAGIQKQDVDRAYRIKNLIYDPSNKALADQQYNRYESKYNISQYDQLPFCVVVPSYQNVQNKRYQRNLISILQQNYTNYHVVYIDDASPDQTSHYVKKFLEKHPLKDKVQVIRNQFNIGHLGNGIQASRKYCKPNQFYFRIDGDDCIIGKQVLKLFNAVHQQHNQTWAINSNSIVKFFDRKPQLAWSRPFMEQIVKNHQYRQSPFRFFVQQSFYNKLFLLVNDSDFRDSVDGQYYKNTGDAAYMVPIIEMATQRTYYLPQITYYYDFTTGMNEGLPNIIQNQIRIFIEIQHKNKYKKLDSLFKPGQLPQKLKVRK